VSTETATGATVVRRTGTSNICDSARKEMRIGPGRGSSAGSLICYLTGITNIDPIEHKLMFERFINLDRIELPDIDLDFEDVGHLAELKDKKGGDMSEWPEWMQVRFWIASAADERRYHFAAGEATKNALDAAGVHFAYPRLKMVNH
jgi:hypothetical protein